MRISVENDEMLGRAVEKELYFELFNRLKEKDKEIENLKQEIDKLVDTIEDVNREFSQYKYESKKEIERLNNIINELEEYIHNELILDFYNDDMPCELIINKIENMIKKLKAGDKE